jgi:shikimate kinase
VKSDRVVLLQAEAETVIERLKETSDRSERKALLQELSRVLDKLDSLHDEAANRPSDSTSKLAGVPPKNLDRKPNV